MPPVRPWYSLTKVDPSSMFITSAPGTHVPGAEVFQEVSRCQGDSNSCRRGGSGGCPGLAADKLHGHPGQGVGLGQHGHRCLGDDLVADEFGHFQGHVRVGYSRLRGLQVFGLDGQIGNGVGQPVLQGAEAGANVVLGKDGVFQSVEGLLGALLGGDGKTCAWGRGRGRY
jgi:hypothetical protein